MTASESQAAQPPPSDALRLSNEQIAERLEEVGNLLQSHGANPFRATAYHNAAATLRGLRRPVQELLAAEGVDALLQLPAIGDSLAHSIESLVRTGRLALLERLRGEDAPARIFTTVANIGPLMAQRIYDHLGIETLAELEASAYDGRLAKVPGMGTKRVQGVRESLAGRFRRGGVSEPTDFPAPSDEPPVAELLDIDREYRERARKGHLPRIAPRRFNPTAEAWLPILHTEREGRQYTALYSNTARAHELGTVHDWVVIYRDDQTGHGRWTAITSRYGKLRGQRIIRGREAECLDYYGVGKVKPR